jgi:hypothetical protein
MAIGEFLGKMYNGYMGTDKDGNPTRKGMLAQAAGSTFDYMNAYKQSNEDEALAAQALAQQQQIAQEQLGLARQRAAEEAGIRQGIVNRSQMLEQAINQARDAMGDFKGASQGDINANYAQIREQMMGDLNNTIDRVSSQGYADAISKGMDRSDRFKDSQRELSTSYADQMRKIDQEAYNAAINRTQANQDTLFAGREMATKDVGLGYQSAIDNLKGIMPDSANAGYEYARGASEDMATARGNMATDSAKARGTMGANLSTKYGDNLGFMLGKDDNFTNSSSKKLAELEQQNADLTKRLKNAGI